MALPDPKPDFLCIGAAKAGTTWFHKSFGRHPDVWMSLLKETHYYDRRYGDLVRVGDAAVRRRIAERAEYSKQHNGPLGTNTLYWEALRTDIGTPDWYRRVFTHPGNRAKVLGESTPAYCALPPDGIRAIWDDLPGVKIVHFIRDPVTRALSALRMQASTEGYAPDAPPPTSFWHERVDSDAFFARGDYATHIPRWRAVFPANRLLYIPFAEIRTDPLGVLRRIERHLDLPVAQYDIGRISTPVHTGARFIVPVAVRDRLEEELAAQWAFLMDTFPSDFCKRL